MKRVANIVSLAVILACAGTLMWLFRAPSAVARNSAFRVNTTRTVHFGSPPEDTPDTDVNDQFRDWLLYAVLEESGLDSEALRNALYDVPAVRAGFTLPAGAFEFGVTRFRILGSGGTIVALLPKDGGNRKDQLAQIADAAFTNLGKPPSVVQVFEYSLDPVELTANVTRLPDISGSTLFTRDYGFTSKEINSADDLKAFLDATDDVSAVQLKGDALQLSGRDTGLGKSRMRLEDVAALWQSEKSLAEDKRRLDDFDSRWSSQTYLESVAEEEYRKQLAAVPDSDDSTASPDRTTNLYPGSDSRSPTYDDFAKRYLNRRKADSTTDWAKKYPQLFNTDPGLAGQLRNGTPASSGRQAVEHRFKDKDYVQGLLRKRHDTEAAELRKSLSSKGSAGIPEGSGFSLDPSFDYKRLEEVFDRIQPMFAGDSTANLESIRQHIRNQDEGPFLDALYKVQQSGQPLARLMGSAAERLLETAKFQHARYDGSLAGTEDGMVLFYTDLLAKLWALDYFDRAPQEQVRGFVPLLKVSISPIYEKEGVELSGTRLWFGPRDSGFSKLKDGLAFSRVATRVYAASSNTLQPGKEAEANAASSQFLGWWNDHYAQVADYEHQYERLNEIMKWSVILGWLPGAGSLDQMSFLSSVPVKRDNWFPDWARQETDLRFRDWTRESDCADGGKQKIAFFEKGYLGVETESMPILYSCRYPLRDGFQAFSGGVSLGSRTEIEGRNALAETVDAAARRANLEPIETAGKDVLAFKTTDKMEIHFPPLKNRETAVAEVKAAVKLRSLDVEMKEAPLQAEFQKRSDGLAVGLSQNGQPMSEVVITRHPGGHIDVLERPRLQETARGIGRTIGRAFDDRESAVASLGERPEVRRAVEAGDSIYVETRQAPGSWIRYKPEGDPQVNISSGVDMRIGYLGNKPQGSRWNVSFIDTATAKKEISAGGRYLYAEEAPGVRPGVAFTVMGRGPPPPPGKTFITDFGDGPPENRNVMAFIADGGGRGRGTGGGASNSSGGGSGGGGFKGRDNEASFGPDDISFKAVEDPDHLLAWVESNRRSHMDRADKLIEQGKFEEAARELDDLASVIPNDPQILMRRAIAKAGSQAKDRAAAASALKLDNAEMRVFADRLDAAAQHASGPQARDMHALFVGTAAKIKGKPVRFFFKPDNTMGVEVGILDARMSAETGVTAGDLRYTFATVDPAPTIRAAGTLPPPSKPLRIQDVVIAGLEPDRVYDQTSGYRYERVSAPQSRPATGGSGSPPRSYRDFWNSYSGCDSMSKEERAQHRECRDTLVVDGGDQTSRAAL